MYLITDLMVILRFGPADPEEPLLPVDSTAFGTVVENAL